MGRSTRRTPALAVALVVGLPALAGAKQPDHLAQQAGRPVLQVQPKVRAPLGAAFGLANPILTYRADYATRQPAARLEAPFALAFWDGPSTVGAICSALAGMKQALAFGAPLDAGGHFPVHHTVQLALPATADGGLCRLNVTVGPTPKLLGGLFPDHFEVRTWLNVAAPGLARGTMEIAGPTISGRLTGVAFQEHVGGMMDLVRQRLEASGLKGTRLDTLLGQSVELSPQGSAKSTVRLH
ncbi:MAG: hypothetical protein IT371_06820 [Deltaproteobacteria bacterium]|nr:hypothetical protein [Deltaproteobacteria bacterium]